MNKLYYYEGDLFLVRDDSVFNQLLTQSEALSKVYNVIHDNEPQLSKEISNFRASQALMEITRRTGKTSELSRALDEKAMNISSNVYNMIDFIHDECYEARKYLSRDNFYSMKDTSVIGIASSLVSSAEGWEEEPIEELGEKIEELLSKHGEVIEGFNLGSVRNGIPYSSKIFMTDDNVFYEYIGDSNPLDEFIDSIGRELFDGVLSKSLELEEATNEVKELDKNYEPNFFYNTTPDYKLQLHYIEEARKFSKCYDEETIDLINQAREELQSSIKSMDLELAVAKNEVDKLKVKLTRFAQENNLNLESMNSVFNRIDFIGLGRDNESHRESMIETAFRTEFSEWAKDSHLTNEIKKKNEIFYI